MWNRGESMYSFGDAFLSYEKNIGGALFNYVFHFETFPAIYHLGCENKLEGGHQEHPHIIIYLFDLDPTESHYVVRCDGDNKKLNPT
jgi:hypothetical protein